MTSAYLHSPTVVGSGSEPGMVEFSPHDQMSDVLAHVVAKLELHPCRPASDPPGPEPARTPPSPQTRGSPWDRASERGLRGTAAQGQAAGSPKRTEFVRRELIVSSSTVRPVITECTIASPTPRYIMM